MADLHLPLGTRFWTFRSRLHRRPLLQLNTSWNTRRNKASQSAEMEMEMERGRHIMNDNQKTLESTHRDLQNAHNFPL